MKKIILLLVAALAVGNADVCAASCEIPMMVVVNDDTTPLPQEAVSYLQSKLQQIITQNGVATDSDYAQFMIVAKVTPLSKDIVPGPPAVVSECLQINFYIADYFGEKVLATATIELQATGTNEARAFVSALRSINPRNKELLSFVEAGKTKIISYYDNNYQHMIAQAQSLASRKQFEEAIFRLTLVPVCSNGYAPSMAACADIFNSYVDFTGERLLAQARAVWAAQQNAEGAAQAGALLSQIYPEAKCYSEAMALHAEIKARIRENWDFEMKQYNDAVSLESQRINAMREVGVVFGKGQQPTTTHLNWIR